MRQGEGRTSTWRISGGQGEEETLRGLYENYLTAGRQAGDPRRPSYDNFAREIARQASLLRGKADCTAVDFKIYCEDNRVKIKAKPAA